MFPLFKGGGGGTQKCTLSCGGGGAESFGPAIFTFCRPGWYLISLPEFLFEIYRLQPRNDIQTILKEAKKTISFK